jgi:hypothetical protein
VFFKNYQFVIKVSMQGNHWGIHFKRGWKEEIPKFSDSHAFCLIETLSFLMHFDC